MTDLRPPRRDAGDAPTRIARRHHVVLTYRGVLECDGGARSSRVTVDPTSALLLNPGDHFRLSRPAAADAWATVVSLTPEFAARLSDVSDTRRFRAPRALLHAAALLRLHRLRHAWYAGEPGTALVETLADLAWAPDTSSQVTHGGRGATLRHRNLAERARLVLACAPAAAHRLEQVAASLGVSAFHLAHVFRRHVGVSTHRYLLQLRLAAAASELLTSDVGLSTLAFDLGFSSHSHFTAVFARFFGVTPSGARRLPRA